ncbi:FIST signal transduction protein [Magnetospirillum sp. UT-4]|uniref:FIST signal transduction protein n=1 Tax=Magnetospirillum sp. UT-4 TaxID=2681467 RepID=UPI0013825462|nr:FIST N-terminal domain-containing protein [Magnetospirillum sp. UT-4]CAA7627112.1 conserved hypothetical protein [Magnetospirillum sp. UT-4]
MKIAQASWKGDAADIAPLAALQPQLVLAFGSVGMLGAEGMFTRLTGAFPGADLAGCSTAGEITARGVSDDTLVLTAIRFDGVRHRVAEAAVPAMDRSEAAGRAIGAALKGDGPGGERLAAILLFGKGLDVNGSSLIEGVIAEVGAAVPVSGGLAGDGGAFKRTLTVTPSGIQADAVVGIGLYGAGLRIGHGSFGGWVPFGPARKVTRCSGNILHELDGLPALNIYREYLGEYAKDLPASGLLFPFEMLDESHASVGLIRTILGIDEQTGSLVLAGDIDPDGHLRLMHASTDKLVDGAETAARRIADTLGGTVGDGLGVLVSCVGRKLVMGDAVDEEIEAVAAVLGKSATLTGFYSYGEIAPFSTTTDCKLHNQTMTVTFIGET